MARIRTIKPEFFKHEDLYGAEIDSGLPIRIAFAGLWTQCDREGRFRWRWRQLKTDILPYDDIEFSRVLDALATRGFIVKYASNGEDFGHIPSWHKHQVMNNREKDSEFPDSNEVVEIINEPDACPTRAPRVSHACPTRDQSRKAEGKGRERKRRTKGSAFVGRRTGVG